VAIIGSQISATSAYHVVATSLDNQFGLALVPTSRRPMAM
jgi:hypothetical protein